MAASSKGNTVTTLLDLAKLKDPKGGLASIVDPISKLSPVMESAFAFEGNLDVGHEVTSILGLPTVAWRRHNEGIDPSKAQHEQFVEVCGMLAGLAKCDASLARRHPGGEAAYRVSADETFLAAMGEEFERAFWYESIANYPKRIHGLTPRFGSISTTPGAVGYQVIAAHGTAAGDTQNSLWLLHWGKKQLGLIHPRATPVGINTIPMPLAMIEDENSKQYPGYQTWFEMSTGVAVENFRHVVRICNIDSDLFSSTGSAITDAMSKAYHRIQSWGTGRPVFYCNRLVAEYIDIESNYKSRNTVTIGEWGGRFVPTFRGIPILVTDGLLTNGETLVS